MGKKVTKEAATGGKCADALKIDLKAEWNKLTKENRWLRTEVNRLEGELRQVRADRDNWRKQALEENSRLEEILQRLRRYLDASEEEERRSKAHMDAYNAKTAAFNALLKYADIPKGGAA
jgi:predicted  nucleic acid-binding Zn-ribbon protein